MLASEFIFPLVVVLGQNSNLRKTMDGKTDPSAKFFPGYADFTKTSKCYISLFQICKIRKN